MSENEFNSVPIRQRPQLETLVSSQSVTALQKQLTAAQLRVEELEREIKALELACDKQREARKRVERQNELVGEDIVILSRTRMAAERERDEAKSVNVLLTADNQRLRELLRECDGWLNARMFSDHPLRVRIKAEIGE